MITDLINTPFNSFVSKSTEPVIEEKGFTIVDRANGLVAPGEVLFKVSLPIPGSLEDRARPQAESKEASREDEKTYWIGVKYFVKGFMGSSRSFSEPRVRVFSSLPLTDKEQKEMTGLEKTYHKKDLASCLDDFLASQKAIEVKKTLVAKEELATTFTSAEPEEITAPNSSKELEVEQVPTSSSNEDSNAEVVVAEPDSSEDSKENTTPTSSDESQIIDNDSQTELKSDSPS
ncbi:MAG: hypothetical protein GWP59_05600 [Chlamydiales bacterium]|nr:hypothetical protein [Chlamydiales bacterium]